MYKPPVCERCGGTDYKRNPFLPGLTCTKCGCYTRNEGVMIFINPHEPEPPPSPVADESWAWIALALIIGAVLFALRF